MDFNLIKRALLGSSFIRICSMLVGMALNVYIVRLLGAEEAGKYYFLIGLIGTLASISTLGLNNWLIREFTKQSNDSDFINDIILNVLVRVLFSCSLIISFTWLISEQLLALLKRSELEAQLLFLLPIIFLLACKPYFIAIYQADERVKTASFLQSLFLPLITLITLLIWGGGTSQEMGYIYVVSVCITLFSIGLYYHYNYKVKLSFQLKKIKEFNTFFTLHLIYNLTPLYSLLINGYFLDNVDFAIYNASFRLTVLASFLLIVFNFISAPKYARYFNEGKLDELASYSQLITKLIFVILTPILFIIFFTSDLIMSLYGPEFSEYGYILLILFIGQFSNSIFGSAGYILTLTGHEKDLTNWNLILLPVNFIISFISLYFMGLLGAAISVTVTNVASNLISYSLVKKKLGFSIIKLR